jgi:hypothetical protein
MNAMATLKHYDLSAKPSPGLALLVICSLTAAASALASDEMSIEDAARLLRSHEMFTAVQTIKLNTGTIQARLSDVERYQPKYAAFKLMGLIELASITIESSDKDAKKNIEGTRVSLTERGLKESTGWKKEKENEWSVTIAERQLVEVIKVHKDDEGRIHGIEFSWTWAPNKIGEGLKFSYPNERAYAKLERDGKDWRIVSIRVLG